MLPCLSRYDFQFSREAGQQIEMVAVVSSHLYHHTAITLHENDHINLQKCQLTKRLAIHIAIFVSYAHILINDLIAANKFNQL